MRKTKRNTLHDIAEYTGVSYQTVSRVINNHPNVAPETRARVQKAIDEFGYRPNKVAKSLVAQRSNTLAALTFGMNHYGPTQMVFNIERAAKQLGYDLILSDIHNASDDDIQVALDSVIGRQVDGIISITPVKEMIYEQLMLLCPDIPMVLIDPQEGANVPSVVFDQEYGSQIITQHLITLGHYQIAEVSGPLNWYGAQARHEKWELTIRRAGYTPGPSVEGDWTARSGYEGANFLFASGEPFTAIVSGNDQMALGVIYALHEHGLRVPDDISVVGFDDIPEAAFFQPALTTILQDFNQLGSVGVRYLLERIQNPNAPIRQHVIQPQLVIRHSAASPR